MSEPGGVKTGLDRLEYHCPSPEEVSIPPRIATMTVTSGIRRKLSLKVRLRHLKEFLSDEVGMTLILIKADLI